MANFHLSAPLVLASTSQIREKMLNDLGIPVTVINPKCDEEALRKTVTHLPVTKQAIELAKGKAMSVNKIHPGWLVIGADQICEMDGEILSKPGTADNAILQLAKLSGKSHHQHSAAVMIHKGEVIWEGVETATLTMRDLTPEDIAAYVKLDNPIHSCGAYKYEEHGKHLFSDIKGRDDVILGMPLMKLLNGLYDHGFMRMTAQVAA